MFIGGKVVNALIDGLKGFSDIVEAQKRARQLSLNELMTELQKLPNTVLVPLGKAGPLHDSNEAIAFVDDGFEWRPALILRECERIALLTTYYPFGGSSPVWLVKHGQPDAMITGINPDGTLILEYPFEEADD